MRSVSRWLARGLVLSLLAARPVRAQTPIPEEYKTSGFFLGCQAWTWNHFTVYEAIEKTAAAGGKVIEFYPGQRLSPEEQELLRRFAAERGEEVAPADTGFLSRIRSAFK